MKIKDNSELADEVRASVIAPDRWVPNEVERRIIANAPEGWPGDKKPPGCSVGNCQSVQRQWGVCLCRLVRNIQARRGLSDGT
jgi:hypothetical protein